MKEVNVHKIAFFFLMEQYFIQVIFAKLLVVFNPHLKCT